MEEIVQIDESLFRGKQKYNRSRLLLGNCRNQTTTTIWYLTRVRAQMMIQIRKMIRLK